MKLAILIGATKGGTDLPARYLRFVHSQQRQVLGQPLELWLNLKQCILEGLKYKVSSKLY